MEVVPLTSVDEIGVLVAETVENLVRRKPSAAIGLATGSSPLPAYEAIIARHRAGDAPRYSSVRWFMLDEYVGLPPGHPQSYRATIDRELTGQLGVTDVHGPDASDPQHAGARYDEAIRESGGIDLQILGIGSDGHLAFNEPGSSLSSRTRLKTLTRRTREDNARFFDDVIEEVPRHVLTQGLGTILEARHLILVATGPAKAGAVATAVEGPVTASCPASVLQLHPHATVLLDPAAAASLQRLDYYCEVWAGKPEWQEI